MADALAYANKHWPNDPVEKVEMCDTYWILTSRSGEYIEYLRGRIIFG